MIRDVTHAMKIQLNINLRKLTRGCMNIPNIEGSWKILQPLQADMDLVQSDNTVKGTYHNSDVQGTIEGTLTKEGAVLTGHLLTKKAKEISVWQLQRSQAPKEWPLSAARCSMEIGNTLTAGDGMAFLKV